MNFKNYLLLALAITLNTSCSEDEPDKFESPKINSSYDTTKEDKKVLSVIGSNSSKKDFTINVSDIYGQAIKDASITMGEKNGITNQSGIIRLENVKTHNKHAVVRVKKDGYETSLRTVLPQTKENIVQIVLIDAVSKVSLDAKLGGELSKDGIKLKFPENSLVDSKGKIFEGDASIKIVNYSPKDENFLNIYPGNLRGITEDNKEVGLASDGMLTVEMTDKSGNKLQVAKGKTVKVTMPASKGAPSTIPLWHLNEKHGLWVETGKAIKKNNHYSFEATHFSTYNLDFPEPVKMTTLTFKDKEGKILTGARIYYSYINILGNNTRGDFTTFSGSYSFYMAKQEYSFWLKTVCEDKSVISKLTVGDQDSYEVVIDKESIPKNDNLKLVNITGKLELCDKLKYEGDTDYLEVLFESHEEVKSLFPDGEIFINRPVFTCKVDDKTGEFKNVEKSCVSNELKKGSIYVFDPLNAKVYTYGDYTINPLATNNFNLSCPQNVLDFNEYFDIKHDNNVLEYKLKQKAIDENLKIYYSLFTGKYGDMIAPDFNLKLKGTLDISYLGFKGKSIYFLFYVRTNKGLMVKRIKIVKE